MRKILLLLLLASTSLATVTETTVKNRFSTNGSTTSFDCDFDVIGSDTSDIVVILTDSAGDSSTLVEGADYTLSASNNIFRSGCTVTTINTYASGYTITAYRSEDLTQGSSFTTGGRLDAVAIETAFDKLTLNVQDIWERLDRTPHGSVSDADADWSYGTAVERANTYPHFDKNGLLELVSSLTVGSSSSSSSATANIIILDDTGPTYDVNVATTGDLTILILQTDVNSVSVGGTVGADPNDRMIVWKRSGSGTATVIHNSGYPQEFQLATGSNEAKTDRNSIWSFIFNESTGWEQVGGSSLADGLSNYGTDPDVDAVYQLGLDTDGLNAPNDVTVRVVDMGGDTQYSLASTHKALQITILDPENVAAADLIPVFYNCYGGTIVIVKWSAWSNADDVSLEIEEITSSTDFTQIVQVDAVEIASDGTGVFYASDTTISNPNIEAGNLIAIDYDTNDAANYVFICIEFYINADVD